MSETNKSSNDSWFIVQRWQGFFGEGDANRMRVLAIVAFYVVELLNYYGLNVGPIYFPKSVDGAFHMKVTAIAATWLIFASLVMLFLNLRRFPEAMKFITTTVDAAFLTVILLIADGIKSPLLPTYFLVIVVSALRFDRRVVFTAAAACMSGYLFLVGDSTWYRPALHVPHYHSLIFLIAEALVAFFCCKIIDAVRGVIQEFGNA